MTERNGYGLGENTEWGQEVIARGIGFYFTKWNP